MNGYIYSKEDKKILNKVISVTSIKNNSVIGDISICNLNLEKVDFIITDISLNIGDTLPDNIIDNRTSIKTKDELVQDRLQMLGQQITNVMLGV